MKLLLITLTILSGLLSAQSMDSYNPSTGEILGSFEVSTNQEIDNAVKNAQKVKSLWTETTVEKRLQLLSKIAQRLKEQKEHLAKAISTEVGLTISTSREEIDGAIAAIEWQQKNAPSVLKAEIFEEVIFDVKQIREHHYSPIGVAAIFPPSNYPLVDMFYRVLPNLVVGNPVIIKAHDDCCLFTKEIEVIFKKIFVDKYSNVVQFLYGNKNQGIHLLTHLGRGGIEFVCFTGSTSVGKIIQKQAADKGVKCILELSGAARGIFMKNGDIETLKSCIEFNREGYNGLICDGLSVLAVHQSRFEEVKSMLIERANKINLASKDVFSEECKIGPLTSRDLRDWMYLQIKKAIDSQGKILAGGKIPNIKGFFLDYTIIEADAKNTILKEEIFGPVIVIVPFGTDQEALEICNKSNFSLGGYLITGESQQDRTKAIAFIKKWQTSMVSINGSSYVDPGIPFGGFNDSGIGRINGKEGLLLHTELKVITYPSK